MEWLPPLQRDFSSLRTLLRIPATQWQYYQAPDSIAALLPSAIFFALLQPLSLALRALIFSQDLPLMLRCLVIAPFSALLSLLAAAIVAYGAFVFAPQLSSRSTQGNAFQLILVGLQAQWLLLVLYLFPWSPVHVMARLLGSIVTMYLWYFGSPVKMQTSAESARLLFVTSAGFLYASLSYFFDKLLLEPISSLLF